ncbi:hypothetical protein O3W44_24470 [Pantoea sp. LMR881]|uniref:hypothetical protein n=1 Tax=Pantoea sp. LMR881 TaxID=3014336 RepID=UPI0022B02DE3|nr:hypothetical protein [Pantoea sp. LMR881]MCZ4061618.1 hypothetical protein [Pantoea sp. LMR881]
MSGRTLNFPSLGVKSRTVLQSDENTITLSTDASRHAMRRAGTDKLDAIYLGTWTNPYDSRSSAAIVLEIPGTGQQAYCADIQFSGKSGTSAMQLSFAMVKAGMAQHSLAIGADTISRHTAPGDLTEAYTGAGAVVVLFDTDKVIAEVDETFSAAEDPAARKLLYPLWHEPRIR